MPSEHPATSGTAASESRPGLSAIFPKSWEVNSVMRLPLQTRLLEHSGATRGVVRGDEPDCPGKRNLLTALIGLQRAADRRGNRLIEATKRNRPGHRDATMVLVAYRAWPNDQLVGIGHQPLRAGRWSAEPRKCCGIVISGRFFTGHSAMNLSDTFRSHAQECQRMPDAGAGRA